MKNDQRSQIARRVREHTYEILNAKTITFMQSVELGHESDLLYFEFDGEEYSITAQALRIILITDDYTEAANAFIDKLTNIDDFFSDKIVRQETPEITPETGMVDDTEMSGGGHELSPAELANTIQKSGTIEFMSAPGHELFYFKFDNMEYCASLFAVQEILTARKYARVANKLLSKLTNVNEFTGVPSISRLC